MPDNRGSSLVVKRNLVQILMASIRLENIHKTYPNGHVAVKDVNLSVVDGEFLVLVGPSGCGKSTTLRMVAGLEEVTQGDIHIGDCRVNDLDPGKRDIAMVFQNYALYPHMTVRQNMSFGLKMRKTNRAEISRRVIESAQLLSIESLLDRRPAELSGGQRQRVAVGRAIVRQPSAFLFDEPLSNLDAKLRVQMRKELAQLHQRLGTTTIYVTHDQVEAMTLGERIVIMHDGHVQQIGTPMEIYHYPANLFVAGFIGSPAMNLIPGILTPDGEGSVFQSDQFLISIATKTTGDNSQDDKTPGRTDCVFGFRPEHLRLSHERSNDRIRLGEFTARLVERLGDETMVYFNIQEVECSARLAGDVSIQSGDRVTLTLSSSDWHLFANDVKGRLIASGNDLEIESGAK